MPLFGLPADGGIHAPLCAGLRYMSDSALTPGSHTLWSSVALCCSENGRRILPVDGKKSLFKINTYPQSTVKATYLSSSSNPCVLPCGVSSMIRIKGEDH